MDILDLLSAVERLGIKLWLEGESLEVSAPRGALTADLRAALAARKPELVALLRDRSRALPAPSIQAAPSSGEPAPLSSAQRRFWFLEQLQPGLYNSHYSLHMRGRLDLRALERALAELVRRHEVFRTTFADVDGEPRALLAATGEIPLAIVDLRHLSAAEQEREVADRFAVDSARPFDLARGPLTRVLLLVLGDDEHLLGIMQHHILTDGTSTAILMRDLAALYGAFAAGKPSPLVPLPIQYADYARWQQGELSTESAAALEAWWKEQLAGLPPLAVPADRPIPTTRSHAGSLHSFSLPSRLSAALKALAKRENTTLFVALSAAFATLLRRYSDQVDFGIGTVHEGREQPELRDLIGVFADTMVLRCDASGDPSFLTLLRRLRATVMQAFERQLPFDRVVSALGAARGDGLNPLIQVSIVLESMSFPELLVPGMTWTPRSRTLDGSVEGMARFDLGLTLTDTPAGLAGTFVYSTERFDAETIERMARHFGRLVEAIVARPKQRLAELPLLGDDERHELVVTWNETAADFPRESCIHELFGAQARKTPDAVAVEYGDERLSYRELDERSNRLAHYLQSLGVGPDVRVGICVERSLELMVGLLAIAQGGWSVRADRPGPSGRADRLFARGCQGGGAADAGAARRAAAGPAGVRGAPRRGCGVGGAARDAGDAARERRRRRLRDLHVGLDRAAQGRVRAASGVGEPRVLAGADVADDRRAR